MQRFKIKILFFIILLNIACNKGNNLSYKCNGLNYNKESFCLVLQDSLFIIGGGTHFYGGELIVPIPQGYSFRSWFVKSTSHYNFSDTYYVAYYNKTNYFKIKLKGRLIKQMIYNDIKSEANEYLSFQRAAQNRKRLEQKLIHKSELFSTDRFHDSKFNKNYDIFISNDYLTIKKIFYWYNNKMFGGSILNIQLMDSLDNPIKYGSVDYEIFKTCMLDNILYKFSESRMDSILNSLKYKKP